MNEEKKTDSLLENYAKLAIHIYTYFNDDIYKTAKENKYPYSECLYKHYNNENKSNAAKLFLNVIYLDESSKQTIEEIANELNNNSKKTKR